MFTYFIHSPKLEAIKIGRSIKPAKRFDSLRTANPDSLVLLGTVDGDRENEFHVRFSEYRMDSKREWFSMGPALMDFLKAEFQCVIRQQTRIKRNKSKVESWSSIASRVEEAIGCGLRHSDWMDFYEAMSGEILERVVPALEEVWNEEDPPLSEDQKFEEQEEATEPGYDILFKLDEWWPWIEGWNLKWNDNYLDVYLLFKKPSHPRKLEELLCCLAECGYLSDIDDCDFIRLNVIFAWRQRYHDEIIGEFQILPPLDDGLYMFFSNRPDILAIGMDEFANFRLLGDYWYVRNGLPTPEEMKPAEIEGKPDTV